MKEFFYKSSDGKNNVHAVKWECKNKPKAILQIVHGMAEHVMRYEHFAKFLNEHDILVCGEDHIGHGKTAPNTDEFGNCASLKGYRNVLDDLNKLQDIISDEYPDVPYFMLGHSMGSFLCRRYIALYGDTLSGVIVMATGQFSSVEITTAKWICKVVSKFKGWDYRSDFLYKMIMKNNSKRINNPKSEYTWISVNKDNVKKYDKDPYCGYAFTLNGYCNFFQLLLEMLKKSNIDSTPKNLPVFLCAGTEDPIGKFGTNVKKVYNIYKQAGFKDVSIKLYEDCRHEILNDVSQKEVYDDLLSWLTKHV